MFQTEVAEVEIEVKTYIYGQTLQQIEFSVLVRGRVSCQSEGQRFDIWSGFGGAAKSHFLIPTKRLSSPWWGQHLGKGGGAEKPDQAAPEVLQYVLYRISRLPLYG